MSTVTQALAKHFVYLIYFNTAHIYVIYFNPYDNFMKSTTIFGTTILQMWVQSFKWWSCLFNIRSNDNWQNKDSSLGQGNTGTQVLQKC